MKLPIVFIVALILTTWPLFAVGYVDHIWPMLWYPVVFLGAVLWSIASIEKEERKRGGER